MHGMQRRFVGRVVLITGASAGIGAEAARLFADEGATLALVARRGGPLEAVATELEGRGARALVVPADVSRHDDCVRAIETTVSELGGLHVLVNNAGAHFRGPFETRTPEEIATMVDVNARAPLVLTRLALPHLRARGGAVVNVASLAGKVPLPDAATYSATKFALRAFSLALRAELAGSGVHVALVSPGPIRDTGFLMDALDQAADVVLAQPMSTAREVAEMILDSAHDGQAERATPRVSSMLASVTYFMPGVRRMFEPIMKARGRQMRVRYQAERERLHRP
jgi:short-subunit dehydrogenase